MASIYKINPKWKSYNDLHNEGGDGYNPYKKWLISSEISPKSNEKSIDNGHETNRRNEIIKGPSGKPMRVSEIIDAITKAEASILKTTDSYGKKIQQEYINDAKESLSSAGIKI